MVYVKVVLGDKLGTACTSSSSSSSNGSSDLRYGWR